MLIATGSATVTKGEVRIEAQVTVTVEHDGRIAILVEAPEEALDADTGAVWRLEDGDAGPIAVTGAGDDLEIAFLRRNATEPAVLKLAERALAKGIARGLSL